MTSRQDLGVLSCAESLVYYGISGAGSLQQKELFRLMEGTGPQWWLPVSGMTREEFWTSRMHALVARTTQVRILETGCRPSDPVTVEHEITHGRRERPGRDPEYGFIDFLQVRREGDGVVIADLTTHTTWIDFSAGYPKVATAPPEGLDCPLEDLPAVEPLPTLGDPLATAEFRWTARECEVTNNHVAFPSYVERAENALAEAEIDLPARAVWQGWYRHEFGCFDQTTVRTTRDGDALLFGFVKEDERRPRVFVRLTAAGPA